MKIKKSTYYKYFPASRHHILETVGPIPMIFFRKLLEILFSSYLKIIGLKNLEKSRKGKFQPQNVKLPTVKNSEATAKDGFRAN